MKVHDPIFYIPLPGNETYKKYFGLHTSYSCLFLQMGNLPVYTRIMPALSYLLGILC